MDYALKRHWATNIRQGRRTRRMSQAALGEKCDVDQSTVSRWEIGKSIPSEDNKMAIAKAFGVDDPRVIFPLRVPGTSQPLAAAAAE